MKTVNKTILGIMFISILNVSCEKEETISEISISEISLSRETDYGEDWIYFSFETGAEVEGIDNENYQSSLAWDIAFNRYNVRTNGGSSGIGQAAVYDAGAVAFNSVTEAPDSGYTVDGSIQIVESVETYPPSMITTNGNTVFIGAIEFSGPPPVYTPNDHIYIVKTASGKYAKVLIYSFYNNEGESGYINFKYAYQDNGSRSFE